MSNVAPRWHASAHVVGTAVALLVGLFLVRAAAGSVTIAGDATAVIAPGLSVPLDVRFTNHYDFPVSISNVRVSVRDVSAPDAHIPTLCTAADFTVEQIPSDVRISVGAHETRSFSSLALPGSKWPRVGILRQSANRDTCRRASLTLSYRASRTLKFS